MNDILKCVKCGHVLIKGGASFSFGKDSSITCRKCNHKHIGTNKNVGITIVTEANQETTMDGLKME